MGVLAITYRYEATKELEDHFPFVKTVNPPVNKMRRHMNNAAAEVYGVKPLCHGNSLRGIPCFFIAATKRRWLVNTALQETRTPADVRLTNHQKTVRAPFDKVIKARNIKAVCNKTQTYGIPHRVVRRKTWGA